jgi:hypothetical protein
MSARKTGSKGGRSIRRCHRRRFLNSYEPMSVIWLTAGFRQRILMESDQTPCVSGGKMVASACTSAAAFLGSGRDDPAATRPPARLRRTCAREVRRVRGHRSTSARSTCPWRRPPQEAYGEGDHPEPEEAVTDKPGGCGPHRPRHHEPQAGDENPPAQPSGGARVHPPGGPRGGHAVQAEHHGVWPCRCIG